MFIRERFYQSIHKTDQQPAKQSMVKTQKVREFALSDTAPPPLLTHGEWLAVVEPLDLHVGVRVRLDACLHVSRLALDQVGGARQLRHEPARGQAGRRASV